MSDALSQLAAGLASLYRTMLESLADQEERAAVLTQLGLSVPEGTPPDSANARQTIDRLQARADADSENVAELAELLNLLMETSLAVQAIVQDVGSGNPGTALHTIVAGYLNVLLASNLRRAHPGAYTVLEAVRLIDDHELEFERISQLLTAGGDLLRGGPANNEESEADAWSIVLGGLATGLILFLPESEDVAFERRILYGFDLDPAAPHPNAQRVLNRMLTVEGTLKTPETQEEETPELEEQLLLTMAFVPKHHGGPGLFLSLGGVATLTYAIGEQFELEIEWRALGLIEGFVGSLDSSFLRVAGEADAAPAPDAGIEVRFGRPTEAVRTPLRFGGKDAIHLELKDFELTGELGTRESGVLAKLEKAALVIPQKAAGSLLGSILPSAGLRMEVDLALGYNSEKGLYVDGGAGLKATLPINRSILALKIHTVSIELVAKTEDPPGVELKLGGAFSLELGPLQVSVDRLGLAMQGRFPEDKSGSFMGGDLSFSFLPPTSLGVVIDADLLKGGGYLFLDPDRGEYGGILELTLELPRCGVSLAIKAFGLLTERPGGGWAFIVVLSVEFQPEIELFLRFTLNGLGGILGVNHALNVDAIRAGLRDGALDRLLFPKDPVANAPAILQTLRTVFPVSDGRTVVGLMLQLGWGAPLKLVTVTLAVVVSTPEPTIIALLGRLRLAVPDPDAAVVDLRADFLGVIDFGTGAVSVDASLVESRVGWYPLSGDMAFRSDQDGFFFSVGGFHPQFPVPGNAPQLRRVGLDVSSSPLVRLRLEGYLAFTSNTFQIGAKAQLDIEVGPFGVSGWLMFDALVHFEPFAFSVQISAGLELRFEGSAIASLHAEVLLEGPSPWHAKGKVSMSILFWEISVPFDETWGELTSAPTPEPVDVVGQVREALSDQAAWAAELPTRADALVTLRSVERTALSVHPLGRLTVRERITPLGVTVTRVGSARPVGGAIAVHLGAAALSGGITVGQSPVSGRFPRSQFFDLTDDQKLSAPSFEPFQDGVALTSDALSTTDGQRTDPEYETILVGIDQPRRRVPLDIAHLRWATLEGAVARSGLHNAVVRDGPDQAVRLSSTKAVVVDAVTMRPVTDVLAMAGSRTAAEQAVEAAIAIDPSLALRLQVVGSHEVAG